MENTKNKKTESSFKEDQEKNESSDAKHSDDIGYKRESHRIISYENGNKHVTIVYLPEKYE